MFFETDTEPFATARDQRVAEQAAKLGVQAKGFPGHTLYPIDRLLQARPASPFYSYLIITPRLLPHYPNHCVQR